MSADLDIYRPYPDYIGPIGHPMALWFMAGCPRLGRRERALLRMSLKGAR